MVRKFPEKVSRNSGNCLISEIRTVQTKILEISGAKLNGKKKNFRKIIFQNLGTLARLSFFLKILESAVRFATVSCRKFKADFWVEWKAPIEIHLNPMKLYWPL